MSIWCAVPEEQQELQEALCTVRKLAKGEVGYGGEHVFAEFDEGSAFWKARAPMGDAQRGPPMMRAALEEQVNGRREFFGREGGTELFQGALQFLVGGGVGRQCGEERMGSDDLPVAKGVGDRQCRRAAEHQLVPARSLPCD